MATLSNCLLFNVPLKTLNVDDSALEVLNIRFDHAKKIFNLWYKFHGRVQSPAIKILVKDLYKFWNFAPFSDITLAKLSHMKQIQDAITSIYKNGSSPFSWKEYIEVTLELRSFYSSIIYQLL